MCGVGVRGSTGGVGVRGSTGGVGVRGSTGGVGVRGSTGGKSLVPSAGCTRDGGRGLSLEEGGGENEAGEGIPERQFCRM